MMAPPSPVGQKPGIPGQPYPAAMDQMGSSPPSQNPSECSLLALYIVTGTDMKYFMLLQFDASFLFTLVFLKPDM